MTNVDFPLEELENCSLVPVQDGLGGLLERTDAPHKAPCTAQTADAFDVSVAACSRPKWMMVSVGRLVRTWSSRLVLALLVGHKKEKKDSYFDCVAIYTN